MKLTHPSSSLPKHLAVAKILDAPADTPEQLDPSLRRVLATKLTTKAPARSLGAVRLDSYTVLDSRTTTQTRTPFLWSPHTARRLLGGAGARHVLSGSSPSPLKGVQREIEDVIRRAQSARTRPGSLGLWLTEMTAGVRSAVIAEATNYATELLTSVTWSEFADRVHLAVADPVWAVPGAPWITLRGRRDAILDLDPEHKTRALLAMRPGRPRSTALDDLGLVALADALTMPDAPLPTRVVGVWPHSGKAISLEIDAEVMKKAARLVVGAVESLRLGHAPPAAA